MTAPAGPTADPWDVSGRTMVVTGAGSGIGRATAALLGAGGAYVACADLGDSGEAAAAAIRERGGEALGVALDVADKAAVGALFTKLETERGRIDGLVTSAGVMLDRPVADLDEETLDRVLSINLKGTLWCCQAAAAAMVRRGSGSIVTLSSAAADRPGPGLGAYAMSKGAIVQLTRVLALEAAAAGVRVNAIAPGIVLTGITARHFTRADGSIDEALRAEAMARLASRSPMNRVGRPEDIAQAALYLLSDASSFMTGQVMRPNGGAAMA